MSTPRKKNSLWVWFFVFIVVASAGLAGFMIWFNLSLQLKPEQLQDAMKRWKELGPADYLMTCTKRLNEDSTDTFAVEVRARKVVEVRLNGKPLRNEETGEPYPPGHERLQYYSMDRLLVEIERFLEMDAKASTKNYNYAYFDERTGALQRYVRSVRSTRQHVEENVKLEPLPAE